MRERKIGSRWCDCGGVCVVVVVVVAVIVGTVCIVCVVVGTVDITGQWR